MVCRNSARPLRTSSSESLYVLWKLGPWVVAQAFPFRDGFLGLLGFWVVDTVGVRSKIRFRGSWQLVWLDMMKSNALAKSRSRYCMALGPMPPQTFRNKAHTLGRR